MLTCHAKIRNEKGKGFSRKIRNNNKLPGVLYGLDNTSILLILDHHSIFNLQKKIEFYKENLSLFIEDQKYVVKVQAVQRHPFKLKLLHIDFLCI